MSSLKTHDGIAVYGYIRVNFDKTCWIHEIVQIIIQYFQHNAGSLYVFGTGGRHCNSYYGMKEVDEKQFKVPTLLKRFNQNNALFVSTSYHTLIVDTHGDVWTCKNGKESVSDGKLWASMVWKLHTPKCLCLDYKAVSVSTGGKHSLILLENGWVQSFGMDNHFQLGHRSTGIDKAPDTILLMYKLGKVGSKQPTLVPKTIESLKKYKITKICAGSSHSAVLTEDGDLFCFGWNKNGQCGIVTRKRGIPVAVPTKVEMNTKFSSVACGYSRTVLIDQNYSIYSCGRIGDKRHKTPTLIESLQDKRMNVCAAGWNHSICVDEEGIVWTFGYNESGQCGISSDDMLFPPARIEYFVKNHLKAKDCAAGGDQSCVISSNGDLYVFGDNEHYQLGLKETKSYFTPQKLSLPLNVSMKQISMGDDITAMICK